MRQAPQRFQGGTDNGDFCKEGVNSTITHFTSAPSNASHASHGEFLNDASTTAFDPPSTPFIRVFKCITGPFSIGDHLGYQNQTFLLNSGNLDCTRSSENPFKWVGLQQGTPERLVLLADDQRLDPGTMGLISLSKHIEFYLNAHLGFYHQYHTVEGLCTMLKFLLEKDGLHERLERIPESVTLVRCDIPYYNPLKPESKEVIERVVVEYYRSPWTMQWDYRVRVAQVQNPHPWFLSLANGPEKSDESFFDGYISTNHETQSLQATTTPFAAAVTPFAAVHPPGSGTSMDVGIQPRVTTQEPLDTTQGQGGMDSSDDNDNTSDRPLKPFSCPYPDCFKSFTKKGNQETHTIKHYENFPCSSCQCAFSQKTDRDRHFRTVHLGWRWRCNHCSRLFTRESGAGDHTSCNADGDPAAIEKMIVPAEVCRRCQPPEHQHQSQSQPRQKRQRQQRKQQ